MGIRTRVVVVQLASSVCYRIPHMEGDFIRSKCVPPQSTFLYLSGD